MQTAFGFTMIAIGLLMSLGGLTKSEFVVYRVFAMRSRPLWGDSVHTFYVITGLLVALVGGLMLIGFFVRE